MNMVASMPGCGSNPSPSSYPMPWPLGMPSAGGVNGGALAHSGAGAGVLLACGAVLHRQQAVVGPRAAHEDELSLIALMAVLGTNTGAARCSTPRPEIGGPPLAASGDANGVAWALPSVWRAHEGSPERRLGRRHDGCGRGRRGHRRVGTRLRWLVIAQEERRSCSLEGGSMGTGGQWHPLATLTLWPSKRHDLASDQLDSGRTRRSARSCTGAASRLRVSWRNAARSQSSSRTARPTLLGLVRRLSLHVLGRPDDLDRRRTGGGRHRSRWGWAVVVAMAMECVDVVGSGCKTGSEENRMGGIEDREVDGRM